MATITTAEFAEMVSTTPKNLRKFLRADLKNRELASPGKGSRYAIERRDIKSLTKRFNEWTAAQEMKNSAKDSSEDSESTES